MQGEREYWASRPFNLWGVETFDIYSMFQRNVLKKCHMQRMHVCTHKLTCHNCIVSSLSLINRSEMSCLLCLIEKKAACMYVIHVRAVYRNFAKGGGRGQT